jgi:hypothetical protein
MKSRWIWVVAVVVASLAFVPTASAEEQPPPPEFNAQGVVPGSSAASPTKLPGRMQLEGSGGGACWSKQLERSEGVYPYGRRLYNYTVWCGNGGTITYRSTAGWTSHDWLCWNQGGPYQAKTFGGAGSWVVQVQVWVDVACHSPWWFNWNDTLMMRVNYYPNGYYATVAWD